MALSKQSIRKNMYILMDGNEISKEELIKLSESWNDNQENFFRKMTRQGGKFKIQGKIFLIEVKERSDLDSNGNKPLNLPPIPGERTF